MVTSKDLKIRYIGDTTGVSKAVGDIEKLHTTMGQKLKSVGAGMSQVGRSATVGLTLPLVAFGAVALREFGDAAGGIAQTGAVLKSTGGAANVTEAQVGSLADRIGKLAVVDNDVVRAGENMLLTFTNIRNEAGKGNDVFDQATMALADLSTATGKDMKSSAIQLGKALNDPIAGVSALSRVGVAFTAQQKEQITALVESGDTMGAQKVILAELNKEFGGSAKAAGDAATPTKKLGVIFADLAENVGSVLAPMLQGVADAAAKVADWFSNLSPGAQHLAVTIGLIVAAVGPLLLIFGKLASALGSVIGVVSKLSAVFAANPWLLLIAATVALAIVIYKNWDKIKGFILPVLEVIKGAALAVWDVIKVAWTAISGVVVAAWGVIKPIAEAYLAVWSGIFKAVWEVAKVVWKVISGVVKVAWAVIRGIAKAFAAVWKVEFHVVAAVAKVAWKVISAIVKAAWAVIRGIARALAAAWKVTWTVIQTAAKLVWGAISGIVKVAWGVIKGIGQALGSFFGGIWDKVHDTAKRAWDGVKSIITGVWDAVKEAGRLAFNAVAGFWNATVGKLSFSIPDWVPLVGGKGWDVPDIPLLAAGGRVLGSGLAIVGERGPELVGLRAGAEVAPLRSGSGGQMEVFIDRRHYGRQMELAYRSGRRG